jgi:RimJ/RimL family protein N-acetyltransferase
VPSLVTPALPAGTLAALTQPSLDGDDGLRLRPWRAADADTVVAAYADPDIQRWHCRSMTPGEARDWIGRWPSRWQAETGAGWAVTDGSAVAGQISLRRIDLAEALAEVSYWVLPHARGRRVAGRAPGPVSEGMAGLRRAQTPPGPTPVTPGYNTGIRTRPARPQPTPGPRLAPTPLLKLALAALTGWSFGTLGLHRIEVCHSTANLASCRVADRAGYPLEGTKRSGARHTDGWHDMHLHARVEAVSCRP